MPNPYFYGAPVPPDLFVDRRREIRRVVDRIINRGQSTAVVGEPRSGKTSLLEYLSIPNRRAEIFGAEGKRLLFSCLDAHTLGAQFSQAQFWEYCLRPLGELTLAASADSPMLQVYRVCQENAFGGFVLERLFAQMGSSGWRLVLMLDEFDVFLHHPILNCAEFFGSLRSLASRSRGALALVLASRSSLASLNESTRRFSRTGSPYFNFFSEVILGPLPDVAVAELLDRAGSRFNLDDCCFIKETAGGHPYLLQVAASELWQAYEEGEVDPIRRRVQAGQILCEEAALTLGDTWRLWDPATCRVFLTIALAHLRSLSRQGVCGQIIVQRGDLSPRAGASDRRHRAALRQLLTTCFDAEELRTLCFDLGIDHDALRGEGKAGKARELVAYLERHGRIDELVSVGSQMHPHLSWRIAPSALSEVPIAFQGIPLEQLRRDFGPELRSLIKQGFVEESAAVSGGWRVRPTAFLWWLADEAGLLKEGVASLIQASAQGVGTDGGGRDVSHAPA